MDGQGFIHTLSSHMNMHQLPGAARLHYPDCPPIPTAATHLSGVPGVPGMPGSMNMDPQLAAIANARLEMVNQVLVQHLMQVAGLPVQNQAATAAAANNRYSSKTVAPPAIMAAGNSGHGGGGIGGGGGGGGGGMGYPGGNTVAPPSIMRQQARREREMLQQQHQQQPRQSRQQQGSSNYLQNKHRQYANDDSEDSSSTEQENSINISIGKSDHVPSRPFTDEDRSVIIARLTDAIVQWFLDHYNITDSDVDSVPKAAVWDKARVHLPMELGKRVFFNQLMKGIKATGQRIRIKNSMVLRVKMKEHLKPIAEEDVQEIEIQSEGEEEDEEGEEEQEKSNKLQESMMSQMDLELKRCLGMLPGEPQGVHSQANQQRNSVDVEVQADIEEHLTEVVNKDMIRAKAVGKTTSVSSTDGQDLSHIPWHQITSTPAILQGKPENSNHLHQDLTPIMGTTASKNTAVKKRQTTSLERSSRPSRSGSAGSQGRPQRPQRPTRRANREARSSKTRSTSHSNAAKADSTPEAETSIDDEHTSSGVFSSGDPPPQLEESINDSEVKLSRDYGTHNIAQFLSSLQSPDTPRSKSNSRSWRYKESEAKPERRDSDSSKGKDRNIRKFRSSSIVEYRKSRSSDSERKLSATEIKHKPTAVKKRKSKSPSLDGVERKSLIIVQESLGTVVTLLDCLKNIKTSIGSTSWVIKEMQIISVSQYGQKIAFKSLHGKAVPCEYVQISSLGEEKEDNLSSDIASILSWASNKEPVVIAAYQMTEKSAWKAIAVLHLAEYLVDSPKEGAQDVPLEQLAKQDEGVDEVDREQRKVSTHSKLLSELRAIDCNNMTCASSLLVAAQKLPLPLSDSECKEENYERKTEKDNFDNQVCSKGQNHEQHEVKTGHDEESHERTNIDEKSKAQHRMDSVKRLEHDYEIDARLRSDHKVQLADRAEEVSQDPNKVHVGDHSKNNAQDRVQAGDKTTLSNMEKVIEKVSSDATSAEPKKNEKPVSKTANKFIEAARTALADVNYDCKKIELAASTLEESTDNDALELLLRESYENLETEITENLLKDMIEAILSFKAMHGYWQKLGDASGTDAAIADKSSSRKAPETHAAENANSEVKEQELGELVRDRTLEKLSQGSSNNSALWNFAVNGDNMNNCAHISQESADMYSPVPQLQVEDAQQTDEVPEEKTTADADTDDVFT